MITKKLTTHKFSKKSINRGKPSPSDVIGDLLTRIRNATAVRHSLCLIPDSKIKQKILTILVNERFIENFVVVPSPTGAKLEVQLRYKKNISIIQGLRRISKPGRKIYVTAAKLPVVRNGIGIALISTSDGLMTADNARKLHLGGEVFAYIW